MRIVSKLRARIESIYEEPETKSNKNVRLWPLFLWLFISMETGNFIGPLIFEEYRMTGFFLAMVMVGAILFMPMVKLSVKKHS
ncbi:MAG: hypothetical protein K2H88_06900 [Duncaniella sp.]|nr:hypothetical protein [Duncaniella sp.]